MSEDTRVKALKWNRILAGCTVAALTIGNGCLTQPLQAQESPSAQAVTSPLEEVEKRVPAATAGGDGKQNILLKGEVHKIDIALQSLREVALDIKRVRSAAGSLYDEVSMQPINYSMRPNVVGSMVINIPVNINTAAMVQPRPKWIARSVEEMEPTIRLLKQDVDDIQSGEREINLPPEIWDSLQPFFKDWVAAVNVMDTQMTQLKPLTKSPPYDNSSIAGISGQIQAEARKLESTRKKVFRILQKEARAASRREKRARA